MFLVTSPIVINVPTRGLLAVETMHAIVQWLENLNIKRNMTSMFVNKKHRYYPYLALDFFPLVYLRVWGVFVSLQKFSLNSDQTCVVLKASKNLYLSNNHVSIMTSPSQTHNTCSRSWSPALFWVSSQINSKIDSKDQNKYKHTRNIRILQLNCHKFKIFRKEGNKR